MMPLPSLAATKGLRQPSSTTSSTVKSRKHRLLGKKHISQPNHVSKDVLDSILYASESESTFSSSDIGDKNTIEDIVGTTKDRKTSLPIEVGDNIEKESGEHLSRHHDKSQTSSEPSITRRDSNHKGNAGSTDVIAEDSLYLFSRMNDPKNTPTTSSVEISDAQEASDKNDIEFQPTTDEVSSETKATTAIDTQVHSNGDVTITNTTIISKYALDIPVLEIHMKTVTEIRNDCKGLETHTFTVHESINHYNDHGHLTFTHIPNDLTFVHILEVGLCSDHVAGSDNHERRDRLLRRKEPIL
eukprot:scaffold7494_cov55-Attheya_sp.AAC.4